MEHALPQLTQLNVLLEILRYLPRRQCHLLGLNLLLLPETRSYTAEEVGKLFDNLDKDPQEELQEEVRAEIIEEGKEDKSPSI